MFSSLAVKSCVGNWPSNIRLESSLGTTSSTTCYFNLQIHTFLINKLLVQAPWPTYSSFVYVFVFLANVTIYTSPSHGKSSDIVLELGETANVTCEARDAYPPPKFQWKLDGKPLPTYAAEPDNDTSCRNYSCFNLRSLQVKLQDHGKMLSCTAWNHRGNMVTTASKIKTRGELSPMVASGSADSFVR